MKIKIAKIVFLVVCIGAFLFLLLPFLETTRPAEPSQLKAQPQVATDNPLTAIAKRLRTLFGGKERTARRLSGSNPAALPHPADEFLAAAPARTPYAPDTTSSPDGQTSLIAIPPAQEPFDFGDAAFQTDAGEWVLIRQTAPQSGQPGMHEVNVHDNPYDRYVKQERAQRALANSPKPEIPDSKWARLVRPIKQFFGLDSPTPVAPSAVTVQHTQDPHVYSLASATDKKTTGSRYPSMGPVRLPWPDITPKQWVMMTPQERQREQERRSVAQFTSLLSGEHAAQEAAEIAADSKYPNPTRNKEKQEKEEYKQLILQENKEKIKENLLQMIEQEAQGKQPTDELAQIIGCHDASLPAPCSIPGQEPSFQEQKLPQEILEQEQQLNAQTFFENTQYVLPKGLPILPVFGPTSIETFQTLRELQEGSEQATGKIYPFLYKQQQCDKQDCYWIPATAQADPKLSDSVEAFGGQIKYDPLNIYDSNEEFYAQEAISQLSDDTPPEIIEQVRQRALEEYRKNRTNFVPVAAEQLQQISPSDLSPADPAHPANTANTSAVIYLTDTGRAADMAKILKHPYFLRGKQPLSSLPATPQVAVEAGHVITDSASETVNKTKDEVKKVITPLLQENISKNLKQQVTNPNKQDLVKSNGKKSFTKKTSK